MHHVFGGTRSRYQSGMNLNDVSDGTIPAYQPEMIVNDELFGNPTKPSPKLNFHLVVTTSDGPDGLHTPYRRNLCKCLLSAAVLNYPPPVVVNYDRNFTQRRNVTQEGKSRNAQDIYDFLSSKEVGESDLVLIVSEETWLQLPPDITIKRFLRANQEASARLQDEYGKLGKGNSTSKYVQNVIFGATKVCAYRGECDPWTTELDLPQSPLASDIYGEKTDFDVYSQSTDPIDYSFNRPRFLAASTVMGKASDLLTIYDTAMKMPHYLPWPEYDTQAPLAYLYMYQEILRQYCDTDCFRPHGMGVDYYSSLFQMMDEAENDIRFLKFNQSIIVASPSKIEKDSFKDPITLPSDLDNFKQGPFALHSPKLHNALRNIEKNGELPALEDLSWSEIPLATNIIVPGTGVPSMLNFHRLAREERSHHPPERLLDKWWSQMWFHEHAKALMEKYTSTSGDAWAAGEAERGGREWWNMRGGKGGVWTGRGAWFSWEEWLCFDFAFMDTVPYAGDDMLERERKMLFERCGYSVFLG
ncbi:hypothetical protein HYALB_00000870 [Hymenoscyphus albidus]|uniref:Uncharacterized protein n=1 Tax=Hymenoscyphus albidus TaxID=595503 RepID=A0A9N9Q2D7_9HELO|nr:hypothetical protein HYALB_00000870 [Hymenoscyphus albidus]